MMFFFRAVPYWVLVIVSATSFNAAFFLLRKDEPLSAWEHFLVAYDHVIGFFLSPFADFFNDVMSTDEYQPSTNAVVHVLTLALVLYVPLFSHLIRQRHYLALQIWALLFLIPLWALIGNQFEGDERYAPVALFIWSFIVLLQAFGLTIYEVFSQRNWAPLGRHMLIVVTGCYLAPFIARFVIQWVG